MRACRFQHLTTRMKTTSYLRKSTTAISLICITTILFLKLIRPITNKVIMKFKIQTRNWTQQGMFQIQASNTAWTKTSPTANCNLPSSQMNPTKTIKMSQSKTKVSTNWMQQMIEWYLATEKKLAQPPETTLPTKTLFSTIRATLIIRVARRVITNLLANLEIKIKHFWQLVPWMVDLRTYVKRITNSQPKRMSCWL